MGFKYPPFCIQAVRINHRLRIRDRGFLFTGVKGKSNDT